MYDSFPVCRSVIDHWIYQDAEYLKSWITMLSRARYLKEEKFGVVDGIAYTLNYGEFIFGRKKWCELTGISEQRIRHLLSLLEKDDMIEKIRTTSRFTIFKIRNYEKYNQQKTAKNQQPKQTGNLQTTNGQPGENLQTTTNEEGPKKDKKVIYAEQVTLFEKEYQELLSRFGEADTKDRIERLSLYKLSKGKKYASDYATILAWARKEQQKPKVSLSQKTMTKAQADAMDKYEYIKLMQDGWQVIT